MQVSQVSIGTQLSEPLWMSPRVYRKSESGAGAMLSNPGTSMQDMGIRTSILKAPLNSNLSAKKILKSMHVGDLQKVHENTHCENTMHGFPNVQNKIFKNFKIDLSFNSISMNFLQYSGFFVCLF